MKHFVFAALSTLVFSAAAQAADMCTIVVDRTPCAEKHAAEVYKPYAGKNPTSHDYPKIKTAEDCIKEGESFVKIIRKGKIGKKVAKISFGGKEIATKEDTSKECEK